MKKGLLKAVFFITAICGFVALHAQSNMINVDLQGSSIDADPFTIGVGQSTALFIVIQNNGPQAIPVGQATATITIDPKYVTFISSMVIEGGCGVFEIIDPKIINENTATITIKNTKGIMPVSGTNKDNVSDCMIKLQVKGKAVGTSRLNLATSIDLLSKNVSDRNGNNQSATGQINVTSTTNKPRKGF